MTLTKVPINMTKKGDIASLLDWDGADPTGNNDNTSYLVAALAQSQVISLPVGRWVMDNADPFELSNYHQIFGPDGGEGAGSISALTGGAKLIGTGSATAMFTNANPAASLQHCKFRNFTVNCSGTYGHVFDLLSGIGNDFRDVEIEATGSATGCIRFRRITGTSTSWVNNIKNCRLRVPNAATVYSLDIDSNDADISGNVFGGGLGFIDRSTGNIIRGNLINNANASGAGLTISLEADTTGVGTGNGWGGIIALNRIEENAGYDLIIDALASDALAVTRVGAQIIGNHFRSAAATAAIWLKPATSKVMTDVTITGGNQFKSPPSPAIIADGTKWKASITGNTYRVKNQDRPSAGMELNANLTISSGAVVYTGGGTVYLGTQGAAAADDLDTMTGGMDGDVVILRNFIGASRIPTVKTGTGNFLLTADAILTDRADCLTVQYNAADAVWWEVSRAI